MPIVPTIWYAVLDAPPRTDADPDQPTAAQRAAAELDSVREQASANDAAPAANDAPAAVALDATDGASATQTAPAEPGDASGEQPQQGAAKSRSGWWQRTFG